MEIENIQYRWSANRQNTALCINAGKLARIVMGFFLFGFFVDYGGGFGIKYLVFVIAVLWVIQYKESANILSRRRSDFIVLILIPLLISIFHIIRITLFSSDVSDPVGYAVRFYNTISSPALIVLYPLFRHVGSAVILRQISIGFRFVAAIVIVLFTLNILGIIDTQQNNQFFYQYKIGSFGGDPRLNDVFVEQSQKTIIAPFIAYPMMLMLGYEFLKSTFGAILQIVSILIVGSRGILIGSIALLMLTPLLVKRKFLKPLLIKYILLSLVFMLIILAFEPVRFRIIGVFFERSIQMINVEDSSTLIRVGHFAGYINLIANNLLYLLFGAGPTGEIYNTFLYDQVSVTEISFLNTAIYYGMIYALLYVFWLYRAALKLWRKRNNICFKKEDYGLVLGAAFFWLIGNTNPQMNAPFAIFAFMLINIRILEIRDANYNIERENRLLQLNNDKVNRF